MRVRVLLSGDEFKGREVESVEPVICNLLEGREWLNSISVGDLIDFLSVVGDSWRNDEEVKRMVGGNIRHLASFMEKRNLGKMLNVALRGNLRVLDDFVELNDGDHYYHAQPRGLAVHWLAGNVEILGIFSIIQTLLTKNVSLIRASSRAYKEFVKILTTLSETNTGKIKGGEIAKTFAVVLIDKEDRKNQNLMSQFADIRIAWGGKEAVETIVSLPKKSHCEDLIYGPKYSYVVVDQESLSESAEKISDKIALDVSVFDQYACSSPHTVFVEGGDFGAERFAEILANSLEKVNRMMLPKRESDPARNLNVLNVRTEYAIKGRVFSSKNADWTVVYSEEEGLADPCFSRVVFVRPVSELSSVGKFNNRGVQTVGTAIRNVNKRKDFVKAISLYGVDRCPKVGSLTMFESPWDGMFSVDRMVRWVTTWK